MIDTKVLREKILDLAMRGKLVTPNLMELPVNIKNKKIKQDLPKNWVVTELENIATLINGRAYKKNELLDDESLTPVLRVGNLFTNSQWFYSDIDLPEEKYIDNGDLIYAWSASFGPRIWKGDKTIFHYHIWKLDLVFENSRNFLYYFLIDNAKKIKENTTGSTMVHITKGKMEKMLVPFPPIEEQKRIVEKIEELFNLIDIIEKESVQYDRLAEQLDEKVFSLAIQGKLVKQDSTDKPVSELLSEVTTEKEHLTKEKSFEIPENWEWIKLQNVLNPEINTKPTGEEFLYVDIASIDNKKNIIKSPRRIKTTDTPSRAIKLLGEGDIVFSMVRPYLRNIAMVDYEFDNTIGTSGFFVMKPNKEIINNRYLFYISISDYTIDGLMKFMKGDNSPSINKKDIKDFVIPVPPLREQKRIVEKIEEIRKYSGF